MPKRRIPGHMCQKYPETGRRLGMQLRENRKKGKPGGNCEGENIKQENQNFTCHFQREFTLQTPVVEKAKGGDQSGKRNTTRRTPTSETSRPGPWPRFVGRVRRFRRINYRAKEPFISKGGEGEERL